MRTSGSLTVSRKGGAKTESRTYRNEMRTREVISEDLDSRMYTDIEQALTDANMIHSVWLAMDYRTDVASVTKESHIRKVFRTQANLQPLCCTAYKNFLPNVVYKKVIDICSCFE
ncbi:hypothetical protein AVEN_134108-1 [Araneus ventricosus]|uniref:Uncharacterized protein n=1 Tax=Araneus ventricosus TaxID=182803 RepID=A0A4Y2SWY0_ARAVE|nr:hypothetical protein AVEN_134108-1 [Araneus ventricosus]